ncbi:MAG: bifunctional methylenetetrahydrofolate dehydrogenase/methenyltetrahydrofolate cyclohydrolase FolD [Bacteroides sp.]|nr:bifunctional methylenetetrahydrofolate dehydrogenase/methenyltetrahydrofolate cyclohydrolase FolD [Bacillota bacterium]MCM1394405.1 bifunctional methylenetetrahydrofolate dehydrogenase/methenyltetrahydrofolate cyclohydrolase FolD [[Eubacterium] siraeum]MCM1455190.1 bifunctional methylenetetrahydrofolate dehydrogenase/methenyltetrahydrofolate cyclohydrolase FolD [Bacteroides sp.]
MQIIDGKLVARETRAQIANEVAKLRAKGLKREIGLAVIFVGDNPASEVYVRNKIKACEEVGIKSFLCKLPNESTFEEVASTIESLNRNPDVTGMILQLPIPKHLDENKLIDLIAPEKDVDGCTATQKGRLWTGRDSLIACTPYGVMRLLDFYNIPLEGKSAVVVGRSNLVGKPMAQLLLDRNCTVTLCHSRTKNLKEVTGSADIVVVAIGKAKFLQADMVREGAVVVDVGMNRDENGKLCGDVDFESIAPKCSYITPVPGGVGPMTVTMLIANTLQAYKNSCL